MYFDVIYKSPVFSSEIPVEPGPGCSTNFTNTHFPSKTQIVDSGNELEYFFQLKYYHTLNPVCTFNQYHKKIFNFTL